MSFGVGVGGVGGVDVAVDQHGVRLKSETDVLCAVDVPQHVVQLQVVADARILALGGQENMLNIMSGRVRLAKDMQLGGVVKDREGIRLALGGRLHQAKGTGRASCVLYAVLSHQVLDVPGLLDRQTTSHPVDEQLHAKILQLVPDLLRVVFNTQRCMVPCGF